MKKKKTGNVWIGNKRNSEVKYLSHLNMIRDPSIFKTLGLWFTGILSNMSELNVADKLNETQKLFSIWSEKKK